MDANQKKAVETINGPLLIIAGPGSGKTRTLVERTAHMIMEKNIPEGEILLATFTERAARELITRVTDRIGSRDINLKEMYIGTIHSICLRLLEENIDHTGLERGFKILDTVDQKFFIYRNIRKFKSQEGYESFMKSRGGVSDWSQAKRIQNWINMMGESGKNFSSSKDLHMIQKIYDFYNSLLASENLLDFSRIQHETLALLSNNSEVLEKTRKKIRYLMIDEYQDTNKIQAEIIFLIAGKTRNICVVGDDDQGLYRFRGATVENILNFPDKAGPECKKVILSTNYRSEEDIVRFTNAWIKSLNWDSCRYEKNMQPHRQKSDRHIKVIKVTGKGNSNSWNEEIYNFLKRMKDLKKIEDYNQVAFLFRSVRLLKVKELAEYLTARGINVYAPRSNLFFQRDEIRLFIGILLKLIPAGEKNMKVIQDINLQDYYMRCNYLLEKKLGDEAEKFYEWCSKERSGISFQEILYESLRFSFMKKYFTSEKQGIVENRAAYNLGTMTMLMEKLDILLNMRNLEDEEQERALNYVFRYHIKFLLESTIDEYEDMKEYAPKGAVSFLTIHQAKGLEFPVVIAGSLDWTPSGNQEDKWEKDFRSALNAGNSKEPDYRIEEFDFWRAYYTAFSRAKNLLVLTAVENRKGKKISPSLPFLPFYDKLREWREASFWEAPETFETVKEIGIKPILSFTSHIASYERCPKRYRFFKELNLVEVKIGNTFFGTLVHQIIESINRDIIGAADLERIAEKIQERFEKNYNSLSKISGMTLDDELQEAALSQIKEYMDKLPLLKEFIIEAEAQVFMVEKDYIIEGKIDLVLERHGEIELMDFKSGKMPKESEAWKMENYIRQLELYGKLYEKRSGKKVTKLHLYFLGEKEGNSIITMDKSEEGTEKSFELFRKTAENILKGCFEQNNVSERCFSCELRYYCDII